MCPLLLVSRAFNQIIRLPTTDSEFGELTPEFFILATGSKRWVDSGDLATSVLLRLLSEAHLFPSRANQPPFWDDEEPRLNSTTEISQATDMPVEDYLYPLMRCHYPLCRSPQITIQLPGHVFRFLYYILVLNVMACHFLILSGLNSIYNSAKLHNCLSDWCCELYRTSETREKIKFFVRDSELPSSNGLFWSFKKFAVFTLPFKGAEID